MAIMSVAIKGCFCVINTYFGTFVTQVSRLPGESQCCAHLLLSAQKAIGQLEKKQKTLLGKLSV